MKDSDVAKAVEMLENLVPPAVVCQRLGIPYRQWLSAAFKAVGLPLPIEIYNRAVHNVIIRLHKGGKTAWEIGKAIGVRPRTVNMHIRRHENDCE